MAYMEENVVFEKCKGLYTMRWNAVLVATLLFSGFPNIGSLSLKPPAEEILNTHLCPNPVMAPGSNKPAPIFDTSRIMSISLQRASKPKDRTNSFFSRFRPCTFIADSSTLLGTLLRDDNINNNINATLVRIKSINLNVDPWNFSNAGECTKFIMFNSYAEYGNGYPVMCGRDNFDSYLGPYGHPMILYYHLKDQGISFPLFHPNYGQNFRDQKDPMELKYMLIYYSIRKNGVWTCRVQQYLLDPLQQGCPAATTSTEMNCGEYSCSELDPLYQKKMGVIRDGENHQRFIIVKSKTQEKYRVRNFLRQKFVPIVFLLVLIFAYKSYMKAGLRLNDPLPIQVSEMRLRRYHQRHQRPFLSSSRDHFRDIYCDYETEHIPGLHIPYDPTSSQHPGGIPPVGDPSEERHSNLTNGQGKFFGHGVGDPPPSYDSLFPPTYTEATANSASSNTSSATPKNPRV